MTGCVFKGSTTLSSLGRDVWWVGVGGRGVDSRKNGGMRQRSLEMRVRMVQEGHIEEPSIMMAMGEV